MSKYREIVDELVSKYDADTRGAVSVYGNAPVLALKGDLETPFLRALRRKCEKLGIEVTTQLVGYLPAVVDKETYDGPSQAWIKDIDGLTDEYMKRSAVSEGVEAIIRKIFGKKNICIVGRGHAVKGLAEALLKDNHTVTVCHSKTSHEALVGHCFDADVVVLGTPKLPEEVIFYNAELIIDIGGAVDEETVDNPDNYLGPRDIGRLCTSILCNRAARWYLQ